MSLAFQLPAKTVLRDRFELEACVAWGGMAAIYRAWDRLWNEWVAVKVYPAADPTTLQRFEREAQLLAQLTHPGIVRYVTHGLTPQGAPFLAMEWLDGQDLAQKLTSGPLSPADSVFVAHQLAQALVHAHSLGVIHLDIKPSNVFLVGSSLDQIKLLDFGIAQEIVPQAQESRPEGSLGSPAYMSPEQAQKSPNVDARSDLYSLGCVLFECLTGRPPFVADHVLGVLAQVLLEPAPKLKDLGLQLSAQLEDLLGQLLAKRPEERPADAASVLTLLGQLPDKHENTQQAFPSALTSNEQRLLTVLLVEPLAEPSPSTSSPAPLPIEEFAAQVEPFGASAERLPDDSLLAVWSGQGTVRDQAKQAARCALQLHQRKPDVPLVLCTGRAVLKGRQVEGAVVDRASEMLRDVSAQPDRYAPSLGLGPSFRLLVSAVLERAAAMLGQIPMQRSQAHVPLDDLTASLLGPEFVLEESPMGLVLAQERTVPAIHRTVLGRAVSLIGRDSELAFLQEKLARCQAKPCATAVLITAPAGMGKSRLRLEFERKAATELACVELWEASADPMSEGAPFALLASALRHALDLRASEPAAVALRKLKARVGRWLTGPDQLRVTTFLAKLLDLSFPEEQYLPLHAARQDPILMGDQMRRAWEDFLEAESSHHPVLLVLEDLHWGDLPSVSFIESALRRLKNYPFMVLALARPEVRTVFPNLWAEHSLAERELGPLQPQACRKLIHTVLGPALSDQLVQTLTERSAGNPFYLEELLRAVANGNLETPPETVMAMVQARLETLSPEARRVIRAGSIFGRRFWVGGVQALLGPLAQAEPLSEWLAELVQKELCSRRWEGRFPGEVEYVFEHSLFQQAAYAMLTEEDRGLGHQLAGQWLEEAGEAEARVLAEHYERGGQKPKAQHWFEHASLQALEANDFAAVTAWAERGIACGASDQHLGHLRLLQAEAFQWKGNSEAAESFGLLALEHLTVGSRLWHQALSTVLEAAAIRGSRWLLVQLPREVRAAQAAEDALSERITVLAQIARLMMHYGRLELTDWILSHIDEEWAKGPMQAPAVRARIHQAYANRALFLGDAQSWIERQQAARACFEAAGDMRNACMRQLSISWGLIELGDYAAAEQLLEETQSRALRLAVPYLLASTEHELGLVLALRGNLQKALQLETQALEAFVAQGNRWPEGSARTRLAQILLLQGDLQGAEDAARASVQILNETAPCASTIAQAVLAQTLLAQSRPEQALRVAEQAQQQLDALGGVPGKESLVRLIYIQALSATADETAAQKALSVARSRLLTRAARISLPHWRKSFLENVEENRQTLELSHPHGHVQSPNRPAIDAPRP